MKIPLFAFAVLAMLLSGCFVQTGLAPLEAIIDKGSDRDFKFEGTWRPESNPKLPHDIDTNSITIERADDRQTYTATLRAPDNADANLSMQFKTAEISSENPHAIAEIELRSNEGIAYRRLAIAAALDDKLFLWMIDGRLVGEHLYNDGTAAVIEHFAFSSTIRCKSDQLLATIRKHSRAVVGSVQIFVHVPEDGK